jgi:hypothetical protein
LEAIIKSVLHVTNHIEVGDGSRHRALILPRPAAALVPPTKAAISVLLHSLTHFNPTGGIRCTRAMPVSLAKLQPGRMERAYCYRYSRTRLPFELDLPR